MITIDALGKDGRSILIDLDGASPTGGPGGTAWRNRLELAPGDVVRDRGAWSAVIESHHFGMTGISVIVLMDAAGEIASRTLVSCDGAEVRTDARIDSDTLWKLARCGEDAARELGSAHREAGQAPFGDLDDRGSADLLGHLGQTGPTTAANHPYRAALCEAYAEALAGPVPVLAAGRAS